jgi:hypothetical protein
MAVLGGRGGGEGAGGKSNMSKKGGHCMLFSLQMISKDCEINPVLHTAWLNNHALTLKSNTEKYLFW